MYLLWSIVTFLSQWITFTCIIAHQSVNFTPILKLLKTRVVGAHLTSKTNFYGKKPNSYEQLIKVVGARAPSAPLVPPPMLKTVHV